MRIERLKLALLATCGLAVTIFVVGCSSPAPAPPPSDAAPAKKLPTIDLVEKKAFPLEKHLESKDLIGGAMTNAHGERAPIRVGRPRRRSGLT